uniref:Uncharacterized protein n=1 Tax=Zea mays TaxID=4577 RepID=B6T1K1_MAIZE|nr:hypothetical protein [Zea mays]ACG38888.1 hypothetical protein [Zea mays]
MWHCRPHLPLPFFVPAAHFRSAARKHQRLALADCALHRATQPPTLCLLSVFFIRFYLPHGHFCMHLAAWPSLS